MTDSGVPPEIIERLRVNLKLAQITLSDYDFQGMFDKGFFTTIMAFEEYVRENAAPDLPDYLKVWGETGTGAPAPGFPALQPFNVPKAENPQVTPGGSGWAKKYGTLENIAARIAAKEVSPVELTTEALDRISQQDGELNSFQLVLADRALAAAHQAEQEILAGNYRGPLHGVPVAVKDLMAMKDTITTAGSKILANNLTDYDGTGVIRLQEAGAVIVGKTRMSEFAYSPGSNNAHYGPTRNPANPEFDTGGSSSGSGAAVAAGLVYGALGTDTGGSIRIPSALCGLVGLKPTFGRLSLFGATTLSWSLDHLGPMTRTVKDTALLLAALEGYDPRDIRSRPVAPVQVDWQRDIKGLRVGVLAEPEFLATPEAVEAWHIGLAELQKAGAELYEVPMADFEVLRNLNGALLGMEATAFHQPHLSKRIDEYGEFPRQRLLAAYSYAPNAFVLVEQVRQAIRQRFEGLFQQIDLFSTPTMPAKAPPLGTPAPVTFTGPFNFLGWPAATVPVGRTAEGLPLGLQLVGKPWDEATILMAAYAIETALEGAQ